jgi:hypothetical protein
MRNDVRNNVVFDRTTTSRYYKEQHDVRIILTHMIDQYTYENRREEFDLTVMTNLYCSK